MDLINQMGMKALTFNISMVLYAISFIYILALVAANKKKPAAKNLPGAPASAMKPANIMEMSEKADAYEEAPGHANRVAELACSIGERFGLTEEDLNSLRSAALLHDIGMIDRYDYIKENRPLTQEERFDLEHHTIVGYEKVKAMGADYENAAKWVRWHHERWDGLGYPDRLKGNQIPLPVRILTVADAFDAMSHKRPHRQSLSPEGALKMLQKFAGLQFDPDIVNVMASMDSPEMANAPNLEI